MAAATYFFVPFLPSFICLMYIHFVPITHTPLHKFLLLDACLHLACSILPFVPCFANPPTPFPPRPAAAAAAPVYTVVGKGEVKL